MIQSIKVFNGYTEDETCLGKGKVHYCEYWDCPIWQRTTPNDCEEFVILARHFNGRDLIIAPLATPGLGDREYWDMNKANTEGIFS